MFGGGQWCVRHALELERVLLLPEVTVTFRDTHFHAYSKLPFLLFSVTCRTTQSYWHSGAPPIHCSMKATQYRLLLQICLLLSCWQNTVISSSNAEELDSRKASTVELSLSGHTGSLLVGSRSLDS